MAIRTNCIEYGWQSSDTTIPSQSQYQSVQKRIDIPELSSRTFTDVVLQFHGRNSGLESSTAHAGYTMSIQIDSQPTESFTCPDIISNTPEQVSWFYFATASAYFNTYFTASAHNVRFGLYSSNTRTIAQSFKLLCNYQFDDATTTTSIKTVRLPINSVTSSLLGTTRQYLGNYTASIPALDIYLPESSKTYRDIFVEYHANDAAAAATNFQLRTQIDTATSASRYTVSQSLQSAAYYYDIETLSGSISTATTHSIQVASNLANRFTGLGGILYVTYEYDYTGSNTILNSNIYTFGNASNYLSKTQGSFIKKKIYVPETGSITLARSGIMLYQNGANPATLVVGTTSESFVRYVIGAGSIQTGPVPLIFQIDGTGSTDTGLSIASGLNDIPLYMYTDTNNVAGNIFGGGLLYLNYYSAKTQNPAQHTKTLCRSVVATNNMGANTLTFFYNTYLASENINDSRYYIQDMTNIYHVLYGKAGNVPIYDISEFVCFYTGSDYQGSQNPFTMCSYAMANDARILFVSSVSDMTPFIRRYKEAVSTDPKIIVENTHSYGHRTISVTSTQLITFTHLQYQTYHGLTFTITGSIQNYSGSGIIPLIVYDYDTGAKLFTTQSKLGGIIDTYWYDRHSNLMIVAETGSRYVSNVLPAGSGSFSIVIPTAGAPTATEKSFTFIG